MSIVVACSGCPTKLSAPESAAGKQIRCPKCGAVATVPALVSAEEVPVVDATVVSPASKPERVLADEADSDIRPRKPASRDADDEERPRKKKRPRYADDDDDYGHDHPRRRRRKSGGGGAVAAVVIGGLVLVAVIGAGAYLVAGKGSLFAKKTPVPPGWLRYSYPQNGFQAYLPTAPAETSAPINALPMGGGAPFGRGGFRGQNVMPEVEAFSTYSSGNANGPVQVQIAVTRFRDRVPASIRDQLRTIGDWQVDGVELKAIRWLGYDALEMTERNVMVRVVITDRSVIVAGIGGPNGTRATPAEEAGFFDNFELTR